VIVGGQSEELDEIVGKGPDLRTFSQHGNSPRAKAFRICPRVQLVRRDTRRGGNKSSPTLGTYLFTRAEPPRAKEITSSRRTIEVSPGVLMARAPWAAPYSVAVGTSTPASRP